MKTYQLTVSEDQLGLIVTSLAELPFKVAAPVMKELDTQIRAQNEAAAVEEKHD